MQAAILTDHSRFQLNRRSNSHHLIFLTDDALSELSAKTKPEFESVLR